MEIKSIIFKLNKMSSSSNVCKRRVTVRNVELDKIENNALNKYHRCLIKMLQVKTNKFLVIVQILSIIKIVKQSLSNNNNNLISLT